jgi:hypothetical protein
MGIIPIPISGTGCQYTAGQSSGTGCQYTAGQSSGTGHQYTAGQSSGTGCQYTAGQSSGTGRSIIRYRLSIYSRSIIRYRPSIYSRLSRYCGIKYTAGLNATCLTRGGSSVWIKFVKAVAIFTHITTQIAIMCKPPLKTTEKCRNEYKNSNNYLFN